MAAKKKTTKAKAKKSTKRVSTAKASKKKTTKVSNKAKKKVKSAAKVKAKVKKTKTKAKTKAKKSVKTKKAVKQKTSKAEAKATLKKKSKITAKRKAVAKKSKAKATTKTEQVRKRKQVKQKSSVENAKQAQAQAVEEMKQEVIAAKKSVSKARRPTTASTTIIGSLNFTPYHIVKGEEYMNTLQLEHFENILSTWKEQLMHEVDSTVVHLKEDMMSYPDPLDRASQEEGFNLELRTRDRERKLIKKIEQSLDLIKSGDYGFCEDCGAEIGIRRLEARPTAGKCIDCKTFQEIREKQIGGS